MYYNPTDPEHRANAIRRDFRTYLSAAGGNPEAAGYMVVAEAIYYLEASLRELLTMPTDPPSVTVGEVKVNGEPVEVEVEPSP